MTEATTQRTGRLLAALMFGYLLLNVAVIVLAPLRFEDPSLARAMLAPGTAAWSDVLLNVALFIPLGFLIERGSRSRPSLLMVLAGGLAISTAIEALQLFIPDRYTTLTDVLANGSGAALGAWLSLLVRRSLGEGQVLVTRLFLDLPLVGLAWLFIPYIWLVGLTSLGDPGRGWSIIFLAIGGGIVLTGAASAGRKGGPAIPPLLIFMVGGWNLLAITPAMGTHPLQALLSLPVSLLAAACFSLWLTRPGRTEQRVEPLAVRLALMSLLPHLIAMADAPGSLAIPDRLALLRALEHGAAFAVVGYALAEWRGRSGESLAIALAWPSLGGLVVLGFLGWARGVAVTGPAIVFTILAVLFGATLYRAQRAHVLALLAGKH